MEEWTPVVFLAYFVSFHRYVRLGISDTFYKQQFCYLTQTSLLRGQPSSLAESSMEVEVVSNWRLAVFKKINQRASPSLPAFVNTSRIFHFFVVGKFGESEDGGGWA